MYEEHAEHARQHETLRAAATAFFIALIAGLLAATALEHNALKDALVGVSVCLLSILGGLLNAKHYERYILHRDVLRGFRRSLELDLSPGLDEINRDYRNYHEGNHQIIAWIRLNILWLVVYVITFIMGLGIVVISLRPGR
jgi:hypothetical protein